MPLRLHSKPFASLCFASFAASVTTFNFADLTEDYQFYYFPDVQTDVTTVSKTSMWIVLTGSFDQRRHVRAGTGDQDGDPFARCHCAGRGAGSTAWFTGEAALVRVTSCSLDTEGDQTTSSWPQTKATSPAFSRPSSTGSAFSGETIRMKPMPQLKVRRSS